MKKIISSILSVLMVISAFSVLGTTALADENAKEIWNIDDLYNIRNDMNADYILMTDIDMTDDLADGGNYNFKNEYGWNPIGSEDIYSNTAFTGIFDGNNHTIKGLRINGFSGMSNKHFGLFANNSGTIKNLSVESVAINCNGIDSDTVFNTYVGGICAYNSGTIENCHILSGNINAYCFDRQMFAGGIVGYNATGSITKCSNNAQIAGSVKDFFNKYDNGDHISLYMGGICGQGDNVSLSYNSGRLTNFSENYNGTIFEAGISGAGQKIKDCYNSGNVFNIKGNNVTEYVNAITWGINAATNCYNAETIGVVDTETSSFEFGGFSFASASNCYYLNYCNTSTGGATSLTDEQMSDESYFNGFDFSNVWTVNKNFEYPYPQLRDNMQNGNKKIDTIEFNEVPSKTNYFLGDDFKVDGSITVYYVDNTSENIDITKNMLSGYDLSSTGEQTVTVTYRNKTLTYNINVTVKPKVVDVSLITLPDKTEFVRGTKPDYTGGLVRITYDNGTIEFVSLTPSNITGVDINNSGTYDATYTYEGFSVSFKVKVVPVKIIGILVNSLPKKTDYIEGQKLDTKGLDIVTLRNDGYKESISDYELQYDNTAGTQTVTVKYKDFTTKFNINFAKKKIEELSITSKPNKMLYYSGEKFDRTGMVITVTYDNGLSEEITDYETSEITDEIGSQLVKVSYGDCATYFTVDVVEKYVDSISITKQPAKTTYIVGTDFDKTGMEVTAHYNDGTSKVVTDYHISSLPSTVGKGTVKVTYDGKTANVDVTVKDKTLVKITVTPPTKTIYLKGEKLDTKGMIVYGTYDNKKTEPIKNYEISGFGDSDESNMITVSCNSLSASFEVTIHNQTNEWVVTKEATCTTTGEREMYCTTCDKVVKKEKVEKLNHNYSGKVVKPTCTERGYTEYTCKDCGDTYRDSYVKETGHNPITDYGKPATCKENGLTEGSHCNVCDTVLVPQKVIPKLNHSYTAQVTAVVSCTTRGSVTYTCQSCGDSYVEYQNALNHNFELSKTVDATCSTAGYKQYTCTKCNENYSEQIPKLEHKYSEKVVAPTCITDGYTLHICDLCGDSYKDTITQKIDHNYNSVVTKEATCTEEGVKKYTCSTCGDTYTEKMPMTDHTVVIDKAVSATYTANGKTKGSHCSVCGKVIKPQRTIAKKKLAKPTSVKATAMSKSFKLNWKKVSGAKGYEIQYSYKRNFSGAKKITVKSGNATSQTVKKLIGKKKVYIRIRAYYNDKNGKAYSTWTVTNVTTKK